MALFVELADFMFQFAPESANQQSHEEVFRSVLEQLRENLEIGLQTVVQ